MDGQGQLFNDSQFATPPKRPGQMSMDEWVDHHEAQGNLGYHGTFRHDFDDSPVVHMGTMGQAVSRLHDVHGRVKESPIARAQYHDPSVQDFEDMSYDDEPGSTETWTGQVHARRFDEPHPTTFGDRAANVGEYAHRLNDQDPDQIPGSIQDSVGHLSSWLDAADTGSGIKEFPKGGAGASPEVKSDLKGGKQAFEALNAGQPIRYQNEVEGRNGIDPNPSWDPQVPLSVAAPKGAHTSWERDVLGDSGAAPGAQRFAQQRISQGKEGAVPFPSPGVTTGPSQLQFQAPQIGYPWKDYGASTPNPSSKSRRTLNNMQFTVESE